MLYIFVIFSFFCITWPCASMQDFSPLKSDEAENFEALNSKLSRKIQEFQYHIEDTIDYWESLKTVFMPDNPTNILNFTQNLEMLSDHDREMCMDTLKALQRDPDCRMVPLQILQSATMQNMLKHFDKKIKGLRQSSETYPFMAKALEGGDRNMVFLSYLSHYILYFQSRYERISVDPSPIFSSYANNYGTYERQQIKNEITRNEVLLECLKALYPFVKDGREIQLFLSYCPVLSGWLANPLCHVDLDAFCLDAVIMMFHKGIRSGVNYQDNISTQLRDVLFMDTFQIPIINISAAMPVSDPIFKMSRSVWDRLYQAKTKQFAPKVTLTQSKEVQAKKGSPLAPKVKPTQFKKGRAKKGSLRNKLKRKASSSSSSASSSYQMDEYVGSSLSDQKDDVLPPPLDQAIESEEKTQTPALIPQISEEDTQPHQLSFASQQDKMPSAAPTDVVLKQTRTQRKQAQKTARALERKSILSETMVASTSISSDERLDDIFMLSAAHYNIIYDLLTNNLSPTIRYENIVSALSNIGIKVEARGNGDYRKFLLPNGRKIFLYRPAVPQVGQRFLQKLREELFEKWHLTVDNLRHH